MDDFELVAGWRAVNEDGEFGEAPCLVDDQVYFLSQQVESLRLRLAASWVPADVIHRGFVAHTQRRRFKQQRNAALLIARAYRAHRKRALQKAFFVLKPFLLKAFHSRHNRVICRLRKVEMSALALNAKVHRLENLIKTFSSGTYNIKNVHSGKYLNLENGCLSFGTNVQLWDNPESSHSQWSLCLLPQINESVVPHEFLFSIKSARSGRCLSVLGLEPEGNAMVQFHHVNVGKHQSCIWSLVEAGKNKYSIRNVNSKLYLNVAGGSKVNGANVQQYGNPMSPHSHWEITAVGALGSNTR